MDTRKEIVNKLWTKQISNYVDAREWVQECIKKRHEIDPVPVAEMIPSAIRRLRMSQLEIESTNIDWGRFGLRHPKEVIEEITNFYMK